MFATHSLAIACALCAQLCASTPLIRLTAWNRTSISTSLSSASAPRSATSTLAPAQSPPYPIPASATALAAEPAQPRPTDPATLRSPPANNDTRSAACTVNIPRANLDWWFAATLEQPVATLTSFGVNGTNGTNGASYLSTIPITDTLDVASALATDYFFTESQSYDAEWGWTWTFFNEYTLRPTAALTSLVSRTAAIPLPTARLVPATDTAKYALDISALPPATLAIAGAPDSASVATSATPFLYFTAYEVEASNTTQTFTLPNVHVYPYWLKGVEELATATGAVPPAFLEQIPQSACDAGSFQATVTVLIVVDLTYTVVRFNNPFLVHIESSALGFEDVTTDDPEVLVLNTGQAEATRQVNPPMIENSVQGFITTDAFMEPAVLETAAITATTAVTVGTIGTAPIVIGPSSVVVVGSQTLRAGDPAVTIGGQVVSLDPSGTAIVIGGTTSGLPQVATAVAQPPPVLTIGSSTLTGNAATQFFIAPGQTLTPGGTATVDGTLVSLAPSASFIVIGGSTQMLSTAAPVATALPEIVIGGSTITAIESSGSGPTFVVSGQTLAPGQVRTIDGTVVSLAPSGSFIVIAGTTQILPAAATSRPEITVGDSTFTANPANPDAAPTFVISGQTLAPNQVITVGGTTISLGPSGSFVVINGATSALPNPAATQTQAPIITNPPLLTIGSQTYTAISGSGTTFLIGFETLTPGGTITVDGTTIVLAPGATELTYASSGTTTSTALFPATTTRDQSITKTSEPSAGATALNGGAAATTSSKGAGWSLNRHASGAEGWALIVMMAVLGMITW